MFHQIDGKKVEFGRAPYCRLCKDENICLVNLWWFGVIICKHLHWVDFLIRKYPVWEYKIKYYRGYGGTVFWNFLFGDIK